MRTIQAQPFDFTFDPASTALVIIDMQRVLQRKKHAAGKHLSANPARWGVF